MNLFVIYKIDKDGVETNFTFCWDYYSAVDFVEKENTDDCGYSVYHNDGVNNLTLLLVVPRKDHNNEFEFYPKRLELVK